VLFCSVAQVLSAIDQNAVRDGPDSLSAITRIGTYRPAALPRSIYRQTSAT
jgi:hypothetical protein